VVIRLHVGTSTTLPRSALLAAEPGEAAIHMVNVAVQGQPCEPRGRGVPAPRPAVHWDRVERREVFATRAGPVGCERPVYIYDCETSLRINSGTAA
jgi:hypothetical protein